MFKILPNLQDAGTVRAEWSWRPLQCQVLPCSCWIVGKSGGSQGNRGPWEGAVPRAVACRPAGPVSQNFDNWTGPVYVAERPNPSPRSPVPGPPGQLSPCFPAPSCFTRPPTRLTTGRTS